LVGTILALGEAVKPQCSRYFSATIKRVAAGC